MADTQEQTEVRVGPQGRVVIPARIRRCLSLHSGQTLVARVEDGRLILELPEAIIARLKSRLQAVPSDVSLVDELIAERRQESRREHLR